MADAQRDFRVVLALHHAQEKPTADADAWNGVPNKFADHFSDQPRADDTGGTGDGNLPQGRTV